LPGRPGGLVSGALATGHNVVSSMFSDRPPAAQGDSARRRRSGRRETAEGQPGVPSIQGFRAA
jgi:hypothetical protein